MLTSRWPTGDTPKEPSVAPSSALADWPPCR